MARVTFDVAAVLCARLETEGQGRRFHLAFHGVDGKARPLTIGLALAGRDPARIAKLFNPKLETVDPGFGIEVVTLVAEDVEPLAGRQRRLDSLLDPDQSLATLIEPAGQPSGSRPGLAQCACGQPCARAVLGPRPGPGGCGA